MLPLPAAGVRVCVWCRAAPSAHSLLPWDVSQFRAEVPSAGCTVVPLRSEARGPAVATSSARLTVGLRDTSRPLQLRQGPFAQHSSRQAQGSTPGDTAWILRHRSQTGRQRTLRTACRRHRPTVTFPTGDRRAFICSVRISGRGLVTEQRLWEGDSSCPHKDLLPGWLLREVGGACVTQHLAE